MSKINLKNTLNRNLVLLLTTLTIIAFGFTLNPKGSSAQSYPGPATCFTLHGNPVNTLPKTGDLDCEYDSQGAKSCIFSINYPYEDAYPARNDDYGAYGHILQAYDVELGQSNYIRRINGYGNENLSLELTEEDFATACRNHPGETMTISFGNVLRYPASFGVEAYYANSGSSFCGHFDCNAPDFGGFADEMTCKNNCCEIPVPYYAMNPNLSLPSGTEVQRSCGVPPTCTPPVVSPAQSSYAPGAVVTVSGNGTGDDGALTYIWDSTVGGTISPTPDPSVINYTLPNLRGVSPEIRYRVEDMLGESNWCSVVLNTSRCGDGNLDPGYETCEPATVYSCLEGEVCTNCNCEATVLTDCGDGIVQPPEQCDDGNLVNNDACSNACMFNYLGCDTNTFRCVYVTDPLSMEPACSSVGQNCNIVTPSVGTIRGTVTIHDDDSCSGLGTGANGITVGIEGPSGDETTTTSGGSYEFQDLSYGTYLVTVYASSYGICSGTVSNYTVTIDDDNQLGVVDFSLYSIGETPFITINQGNFTVDGVYSPVMPLGEMTVSEYGSVFVGGDDVGFERGDRAFGYFNYSNKNIPFEDLVQWATINDPSTVYLFNGDYTIDTNNYSPPSGKKVLLVNGNLLIESDISEINAIVIVYGNTEISEWDDPGNTDPPSTELIINGVLWNDGVLTNNRQEEVSVNSDMSYLSQDVFPGFFRRGSGIYWIRFDR